MAFMEPEYEIGTFARVENTGGELVFFAPEEYLDRKEYPSRDGYFTTFETGVFARLSAPGYLDCTDWDGPFASLEDAMEFIGDTYAVDPHTGEELTD